MGVPASEVGYTAAMPRREDHEVHKDMWCGFGPKKKKNLTEQAGSVGNTCDSLYELLNQLFALVLKTFTFLKLFLHLLKY